MKIMIIGHSGCGKSTLASYISKRKRIPLLHLDQVYFNTGWQPREREEALAIVKQQLESENWIIEGNYQSLYQKERLEQADQIVFLDFPRLSCLKRVIQRYNRYRGKTRPDMADGCIEKLDMDFIWWILYKGRDKKKRQAFNRIERNYKDKLRIIRNQKELDMFYATFNETKQPDGEA